LSFPNNESQARGILPEYAWWYVQKDLQLTIRSFRSIRRHHPLINVLWLRSYEEKKNGIITKPREKPLQVQVQARTVSRLQDSKRLQRSDFNR